MLLQKCFAVKRGINGYLELVREMFGERIQDANGTFLVSNYRKYYNYEYLKNYKISINRQRT